MLFYNTIHSQSSHYKIFSCEESKPCIQLLFGLGVDMSKETGADGGAVLETAQGEKSQVF